MNKSFVTCFFLVICLFMLSSQVFSQEVNKSKTSGSDINTLSPQNPYSKGNENKISAYPKLFYNDLSSTLRSIRSDLPRVYRNNFFKIAGSLLLFGLVDKELSAQTFHKNRKFAERQLDNITSITEQPILIGFAGLALGHVFKKDHFAEMGLKIVEGAVFTTAVIAPVKYITGRSRPIQGSEQNHFNLFQRGFNSFPSGHTANIFTFATIVSSYYPRTTKYAYGVAGLVGLQRINSGKHWASDVLVGAFIGHYIGKILTDKDGVSSPFRFHPGLGKMGISLSF